MGLILLTATTSAAERFNVYTNERYGFTLRYPAGLRPGPSRTDGSGREFHSENGEFKVFAFAVPIGRKSSEKAIAEAYEAELKLFGQNVTYKVKSDGWFVVSGVAENGLEFYSKAYANASAMTLLRITYPHAGHEVYDAWVTRIEKRFTPARPAS